VCVYLCVCVREAVESCKAIADTTNICTYIYIHTRIYKEKTERERESACKNGESLCVFVHACVWRQVRCCCKASCKASVGNTHRYIHIRIHAHDVYTYMYTHTRMRERMWVHLRESVCLSVCVSVCVCCVCVFCVCVCVCACTKLFIVARSSSVVCVCVYVCVWFVYTY